MRTQKKKKIQIPRNHQHLHDNRTEQSDWMKLALKTSFILRGQATLIKTYVSDHPREKNLTRTFASHVRANKGYGYGLTKYLPIIQMVASNWYDVQMRQDCARGGGAAQEDGKRFPCKL